MKNHFICFVFVSLLCSALSISCDRLVMSENICFKTLLNNNLRFLSSYHFVVNFIILFAVVLMFTFQWVVCCLLLWKNKILICLINFSHKMLDDENMKLLICVLILLFNSDGDYGIFNQTNFRFRNSKRIEIIQSIFMWFLIILFEVFWRGNVKGCKGRFASFSFEMLWDLLQKVAMKLVDSNLHYLKPEPFDFLQYKILKALHNISLIFGKPKET